MLAVVLIMVVCFTITASADGELYEEILIMDDLNADIEAYENFPDGLEIVECRWIGNELLLEFNEEYREVGEYWIVLEYICRVPGMDQVVLYCPDEY